MNSDNHMNEMVSAVFYTSPELLSCFLAELSVDSVAKVQLRETFTVKLTYLNNPRLTAFQQ